MQQGMDRVATLYQLSGRLQGTGEVPDGLKATVEACHIEKADYMQSDNSGFIQELFSICYSGLIVLAYVAMI